MKAKFDNRNKKRREKEEKFDKCCFLHTFYERIAGISTFIKVN